MARVFRLAAGDVSAEISDLGGILSRLLAPDSEGRLANVVLGLPSIDDYAGGNPARCGEVVGRYANRIAGGVFTLDGVEIRLPRNDGEHTLHGGPGGFGSRLWEVRDAQPDRLELALTSPDGDNGFPGAVMVTAELPPLGTWNAWSTVAVPVSLSPGLHTVVLWDPNSQADYINLDNLTVGGCG